MSKVKKPIILTVDDELQVLNAIERDLKKEYGKNYRIVKVNGGEEGIELVKKFKKRGDIIALFLVDQRMPGVEGTEFLEKSIGMYPNAGKVLLTAYADTKAAIKSINVIGLDHYLSKPWDPPEINLYPILDDLLSEWQLHEKREDFGLRVVGTPWSSNSHKIKEFLAKNRVLYTWIDLENDLEMQSLFKTMELDLKKVPVLLFDDGTHLVDPPRSELASKLKMKSDASDEFYDLIIIGAGPAGLAAGVYGASEGLKTIVIEREAVGGQAGTSSKIENYLGFPQGLSGSDLARRAEAQAERLGAEILLPQEVVGIELEGNYKLIKLQSGKILRSYALIISSGVEVRRFEVPGENKLIGAGVYYGAAMTEATHFKDKIMYVLGGGNSAGQGALFFSRYAKEVKIIIRRPSLDATMSSYLIDQLKSIENIEIVPNTQIEEFIGDQMLEKLVIKHVNSEKKETVEASAIFIFIGALPRTEMVQNFIERDDKGYLMTGLDLMKIEGWKKKFRWKLDRDPFTFETNVPGIFAAGDVRHDSSKRVAAAVGEGAVSVRLVHQYLQEV